MDPLPSLNKVFSLVIQDESNNAFVPAMVTLEYSSVSINAYDARKSQGRGKGAYNKPPTRHCTFCNKNNHTVDFCYQKHGFPNVNRPNSQANATSGDVSDVNTSSGVSGLSQDKMEQLVALLQHANLIPSPSTSSSSHVTNQDGTTFFYQKHGFPNVNRPNSLANVTFGDVFDVNTSSGVSGLSQDKMEQLVSLLQQANLIPSPSTSSSSDVTNPTPLLLHLLLLLQV